MQILKLPNMQYTANFTKTFKHKIFPFYSILSGNFMLLAFILYI